MSEKKARAVRRYEREYAKAMMEFQDGEMIDPRRPVLGAMVKDEAVALTVAHSRALRFAKRGPRHYTDAKIEAMVAATRAAYMPAGAVPDGS